MQPLLQTLRFCIYTHVHVYCAFPPVLTPPLAILWSVGLGSHIGQGVHTICGNPSLAVKRVQQDLVEVQLIYVVVLRPQHIHAVMEGLFGEESFFVLLVAEVHSDPIL